MTRDVSSGPTAGDRDALEAVLRSMQPALLRYVTRIVGATLADDAVQDTLIIVARKLNWLEEPRLFRAWAFRIASRVAFDYLRKARRELIHETGDAVLGGARNPGRRRRRRRHSRGCSTASASRRPAAPCSCCISRKRCRSRKWRPCSTFRWEP